MQLGLFLVLIIFTVSAIGCGGRAQTASGSPTPTPVPSPTPASGSPSLSATPSSLAFGTQVLNTAMTQTVKITNTGSVAVAITQGTITGPGFTVFFSSRRRHTIWNCDWSSDVCSSDLCRRGAHRG